MGFFSRSQPKDNLYLMPVRFGNEQLPKGMVRILCCDTEGKIHASLVAKTIYNLARKYAREMEQCRKGYALLCLELSQGKSVPLAVEISDEELWAMEHILEHALKNGRLPDVLKKYPRRIIGLGEARREGLIARHGKRARREATPKVLSRLPYYSEGDVEVSIPIYKAELRYPAIFLKQLPSNNNTLPDVQRVLILDSDGDLAILKVPLELIDKAEKSFQKWGKVSSQAGCVVFSRCRKDFSISYIAVTELQRKALDKITRYFEDTGYGKQPVPTAVQTVLNKARENVSTLRR